MTRKLRAATATVALLAATAAIPACDGTGPANSPATTPITSATKSNTAARAPVAPTKSAASLATATPVPVPTGKPARGPWNKADAAFAADLIAHHAQAIEIASLLLAKNYIDPAAQSSASRIKSTKVPQVEQLRGWLAGWKQPVPAPNGSPTTTRETALAAGHDEASLPGMMRADDIAALRRLDGIEAGRLYLAMMVNHELGAVQLANDELATGRNPDARKLARSIADDQQLEVGRMDELLDGRIHPPGKL